MNKFKVGDIVVRTTSDSFSHKIPINYIDSIEESCFPYLRIRSIFKDLHQDYFVLATPPEVRWYNKYGAGVLPSNLTESSKKEHPLVGTKVSLDLLKEWGNKGNWWYNSGSSWVFNRFVSHRGCSLLGSGLITLAQEVDGKRVFQLDSIYKNYYLALDGFEEFLKSRVTTTSQVKSSLIVEAESRYKVGDFIRCLDRNRSVEFQISNHFYTAGTTVWLMPEGGSWRAVVKNSVGVWAESIKPGKDYSPNEDKKSSQTHSAYSDLERQNQLLKEAKARYPKGTLYIEGIYTKKVESELRFRQGGYGSIITDGCGGSVWDSTEGWSKVISSNNPFIKKHEYPNDYETNTWRDLSKEKIYHNTKPVENHQTPIVIKKVIKSNKLIIT